MAHPYNHAFTRIQFVLSIMLAPQICLADVPPGMVLVPAGAFIMGSDRVDKSQRWKEFGSAQPWFLNEHPQHTVTLPDFYIDKYEVSNKQYLQFVTKTGRTPPKHWLDTGYLFQIRADNLAKLDLATLRNQVADIMQLDVDVTTLNKSQLLAEIKKRWMYLDTLPVVNVTWSDADAYCHWVQKRLPSEQQWEKAARGPKGNEYPWGNTWEDGLSNTGDQDWPDGVAPVGSYPRDKSVYGVLDMTGNVYEWVNDWYQAYPGADYLDPDYGMSQKVVRGSGFGSQGHYSLRFFQRSAFRLHLRIDAANAGQGFRCARDAINPGNKK